ncbi:MAG: PspC domain-containing protein [Gemmatimonadales bacterium]
MSSVNVMPPRLERSRTDRLLAGVAGGIAQHLGVDPLIVRIAFVLLSFALGFGVVVYLLTWLLAPEAADQPLAASQVRHAARPTRNQALGAGLVLGGVLLLGYLAGFRVSGGYALPISLAAIGFVIIWARAGEEGRERWQLHALFTAPVSPIRIVIGSGLILFAMAVFLSTYSSFEVAGQMLLAALVAIGGLALLAGPWVWGLGRALVQERSSRIRTEARAEMAAHLHDSVLQTLALIQRAPAEREMVSLARTQERELRAWLYDRAPSNPNTRLRDAIDEMAGRVEREQHVKVEAVVVGDAPLDDRLRALVAACGEATLNAARHSGAGDISVFVEVEDEAVSAYVRDQGSGFDPGQVADDRRGIADSIVGRIERQGGAARVASSPGSGTEVVLRLPRKAP